MKTFGIYVCVIFIVFAVLDNHSTEGARGGGARGGVRSSGGRRSGGSRSGSGSSGSRSTTRFGSRASYRGPSYSPSSWKTAAAVGTLYGLSSYQRRRRYLNSPDSEPTVCFNEKNLRNGTYGYFICPEEGQDDDMAYCCGDEDAQTCCEYADATAVGRIVGIVFGVIAACVIVAVVVYCVFVKYRKNQRKSTTTHSQNQSTGTTSVQYSTSQPSEPYFTSGSNFQYNQKQDMTSYPPTADVPNVYDRIDNSAVNGAPPYSSTGPIGFDGEKSNQLQNGESGTLPYPTTPYTGFQGMPTSPPPAYSAT